jgi:hypothetical protein
VDGSTSIQMAHVVATLMHYERIRETERLIAYRRANDEINDRAIRRTVLDRVVRLGQEGGDT